MHNLDMKSPRTKRRNFISTIGEAVDLILFDVISARRYTLPDDPASGVLNNGLIACGR
jgi:hypothetical protein